MSRSPTRHWPKAHGRQDRAAGGGQLVLGQRPGGPLAAPALLHPGTRVSVDVKLFGLKLGEGLYGQADAKANFTIGDAHVAVANDITKQISVFNNGRLVRTMPTSMGRGGTAFVAGQTFSWWTPPGVYTVIDKGETVTMDSASYGLPNNSAWGYKLKIPLCHPDQPGRHLHASA